MQETQVLGFSSLVSPGPFIIGVNLFVFKDKLEAELT